MAKRAIGIVDLMVWVIRDQKADRVDGRGIGLFEGERAAEGLRQFRSCADGVAAQLDNIGIGGKIQRIGYDMGELHSDAELVWSLVRVLPDDCRRPIVDCARTGEAPAGAYMPEPRLEPCWRKRPRFDADGRPDEGAVKLVYDGARNPLFCPLRPEHEDGYVQGLRAEYRAWVGGLEHVARQLIAMPERLRRWVVTAPRFDAAPWLQGPAAMLAAARVAETLDITKPA